MDVMSTSARPKAVAESDRVDVRDGPAAHGQDKGCGSRIACLTMVFKLALSAQKRWRALNGTKLLVDVISGGVFEDGVKKDAA